MFPVIILIAGCFPVSARDAEGLKLLVELDREIGRKDLHERAKRMRIDRLRHELDCAIDDSACSVLPGSCLTNTRTTAWTRR